MVAVYTQVARPQHEDDLVSVARTLGSDVDEPGRGVIEIVAVGRGIPAVPVRDLARQQREHHVTDQPPTELGVILLDVRIQEPRVNAFLAQIRVPCAQLTIG